MLKAITEPGRCSSIAAAGPSWPVVLPLVGALVRCSKVLRSSSWDIASLAQACSLLEGLVGQTVVLTAAWKDSIIHNTGSRSALMLSEAANKPHLSEGLEARLALSSVHFALLTCLLSILGVLGDLAWLAGEIARQLLCWEEVKGQFDNWEVAAVAATKAGRTGASKAARNYDAAVFEWYLERNQVFSSLAIFRDGRSTLAGADTLLSEAYAVETVELLLARFGYHRAVSWARALEPFPWVKRGGGPNSNRMLGMITSRLGLAPQAEAVGELSRSCNYLSLHKGAVKIAESLLPVVPNSACGAGQQTAGTERVRRRVIDVLAGPRGSGRGPSCLFLLEVKGLVTEALKICPARGCCNNPRCKNMAGFSEMGLVVGREGARGVCSGCREVCYCSKKCQEAAWEVLHEDWCSRCTRLSP